MRLLPGITIQLTPEQQEQLRPYANAINQAFRRHEPGMVAGQAISINGKNNEPNAVTFRFFPNIIAKQVIKATTPALDPNQVQELIVVTQEELDAQAADLQRLLMAANDWKQKAEAAETERDELRAKYQIAIQELAAANNERGVMYGAAENTTP